jgi:hypothetical protein
VLWSLEARLIEITLDVNEEVELPTGCAAAVP